MGVEGRFDAAKRGNASHFLNQSPPPPNNGLKEIERKWNERIGGLYLYTGSRNWFILLFVIKLDKKLDRGLYNN